MKRSFGMVLGSALALVSAASAFAAAPATAPLMRILITADAMSEQRGGDVDIRLSVPEVEFPAGAAFLRIGTKVPGMVRAQAVRDMSVSDSGGPVRMVLQSGESGLAWKPVRALQGDVSVHYLIRAENIPLAAGGPAVQLRVDGNGFSAQGDMIIATPQIKRPYRIAIDWNLAGMGRGAMGVSSYGDGNVQIPAGPIARIDSIVLMGGVMRRYVSGPFEAVWTGTPNFDPNPAMQWVARLHHWMSGFWRSESEPPYRVFLRFDPMNAGTGAALIHSFIATYGKGVTGENLKPILAHEMTHTFTASDDMAKWYNEGIAVYYGSTMLTPWLAGLTSTEQFLAHLNEVAATYYTDVKRSLPESQVLPNFWKDTRIRILAYDRGGMYFATLNAMELQASAGNRLIGRPIRAMNARMAAGLPLSENLWLRLLRKDLGSAGPALQGKMMSGALVVPASSAFGPCFRRVVKRIPRFDLGFAMKSLPLFGPKIIQGLRTGSNAAKAGLRNGDQVSYAAALDDVQSNALETLTLHVTRAGRHFTITYLPRGDRVDAYQWERIPGVPESACKSPYRRTLAATQQWLEKKMHSAETSP